jgi:hypothetical protein
MANFYRESKFFAGNAAQQIVIAKFLRLDAATRWVYYGKYFSAIKANPEECES